MKSVLVISGNDPKAQLDATLYGADVILYDLHETVTDDNNDAARILIQEALSFYDFGLTEVVVRTNPMRCCGAEDIAVCGKGKPHAFVIPDASVDGIASASAAVAAVESENGFESSSIKLIPAVGSVDCIEKTGELIASCPRISAILFDAAGFLKDLGVEDTGDCEQLVYARSKIALACHASGIPAIDRPFLNLKDPTGLKADASKARSLGFTAKVANGGGQVSLINTLFS